MAIPIISDLLERLFGSGEDPHSRDDVKRRLQIVLAHDRLALDPQTLEMMRQEIIAVVSRYVEVDFESLEFSLATNERVTALTANLPIRRIRPLGRGADQPILPEQEVEKIELASPAEVLALDAQDAEAALRRFEANTRDAHPYLDIDRSGLDEDEDESGTSGTSGITGISGTSGISGTNSVLDEADAATATDLAVGEKIADDSFRASDDSVALLEDPAPEVPDMSIPEASAHAKLQSDK